VREKQNEAARDRIREKGSSRQPAPSERCIPSRVLIKTLVRTVSTFDKVPAFPHIRRDQIVRRDEADHPMLGWITDWSPHVTGFSLFTRHSLGRPVKLQFGPVKYCASSLGDFGGGVGMAT